MIYIGLTGWGDHSSLYTTPDSQRDKLTAYSSYFPTVEVDSSFYAIQSRRNVEKWVNDTPKSFRFIVKAYQAMTGHERGNIPFPNKKEVFNAFKESLQPYLESKKLAMVLFQFPPWFNCTKENVDYLRWCKAQMKDIHCALEFRHQSWFYPQFREKTLQFMKSEKWIHSICDEPQAGEGSIPTVLEPTSEDKVLVRFHGRNVHGWQKKNAENWREVRYLYRYNHQELSEWVVHLRELEKACQEVFIVFNNNSGGDAADNAKQLIELLNLNYEDLSPRQMNLF